MSEDPPPAFDLPLGFRPLADRIVVERPRPQSQVTRGGVFIPDSAVVRENEGVVVAVGPGRLLRNGTRATLQVRVGDHVLFRKYSDDELKLEGQSRDDQYARMREEDVLCVLEAESGETDR